MIAGHGSRSALKLGPAGAESNSGRLAGVTHERRSAQRAGGRGAHAGQKIRTADTGGADPQRRRTGAIAK